MPAINMGTTSADALVNPSTGRPVVISPFSGPKGSPFEARTITGYSSTYPTNGTPTYAKDITNLSTGAVMTGIGFSPIINPTAPASIRAAGFSDDYTPGVTLPSGSAATTSILVAIGGGKSTAAVNGIAPTVPYTAGFVLCAFGNGASRDGGAGPIFQGFGTKMVTAAGTVTVGSVIETGFVNRAGRTLVIGESVIGSATAASGVIA